MRIRTAFVVTFAIGAIGAGALSLRAASTPKVERIDFTAAPRATTPVYDAALPPLSDARVREFVIPMTEDSIQIAKDVKYQGWTFGGTVPGPVLRVREGDLVRVTVVNRTPMPHSIDFHAARIAPNLAYRMVMPNDSVKFEFTARDPGAYLVHCGTPPITLHLMQGMYFAIIVDPRDGWGTKADKEFVLVQSEFYASEDGKTHTMVPDVNSAMAKSASHVVFNGRGFQYRDTPLQVAVGDRVRFFVVNAGPNFRSDFHIVGAIFDRVYPDGNPRNALERVQTYTIPAGGGAVFETEFTARASGEGLYPFVTHAFADAEKGAVGIIRVGAPKGATMVH